LLPVEASLHKHASCAVLRVSGNARLWDRQGAEQELVKLLSAEGTLPGNRLVLNLAGLTHIDSLGITALVKVVVACVKLNVGICTVLPGGTAGQSIRLTRIFAAWPEFASEEVALEQFAQHAAS
jgi:anti-anti-sigma regulatory factor